MLAGVDGYRKRWVAALDSGDGATCLELVDTFAEFVDRSELRRIIIDVPIGLPEYGARSCDRLARAMIGPRKNSVFPAPIRPMLDAASYKDACDRCYRVDGKRCSRQIFNILPLIRSVNENMSPLQQDWVHEGHPEVSFTALGGQPMRSYKAKPEGQKQRRHCSVSSSRT
jgi:predicted RNase H-like nuclease